MKPEQLQDALNEIKDEYITDAHGENSVTESASVGNANGHKKKTRTLWRHKPFRIVFATTVGLILLAGGGLLLSTSLFGKKGIYIPPRELPKPSSSADMVGLICHDGKVYVSTGAYNYSGSSEVDTKETVFRYAGTYLGEAIDNIDDWNWNGPEGVVDLASTTGGSVHTVVGYDEDFRLCKIGEWYPEEGGVRYFIDYYECLSGITLTKGSDLLEDRLHLSEMLPDTTDPAVKEFLALLNEAPFVYVEDNPVPYNIYHGDPTGDFRRKKNYSTRLEITPIDNVTISFIVYKNGYVCYNQYDMSGNYFMVVDPASVEFLFQ